MATIERRGKRFRIIFYYGGKRHATSIKTEESREADAVAGSVERTLTLIRQGVLTPPTDVDFVTFVLSGGRATERTEPPPLRTFAELRDRYVQSLALGAIERNTLDTVKLHLAHIATTLSPAFPLATLTQADLQRHIERRSRQKGHFRKPISPATLRLEVGSFRAFWNWCADTGLIQGRFPNRGLKFPKATEKPRFQTWEEVRRQVERGGLSEDEVRELWESVFLTLPEVQEFLAFAKENARHGFLYPMLLTAAHTGARRGELLAAHVEDVDFDRGTLTVREKKRVRGKRSTRQVPLSEELQKALRGWLERYPGGRHLFCHGPHVPRSKKRRTHAVALTRNEANDHFKRLVAGSKWQVLRGWHVFRHSFISNCASKGADQRMIDEWVGHQTEEMRKRYRHLIPSDQRQALLSVFGQGQ